MYLNGELDIYKEKEGLNHKLKGVVEDNFYVLFFIS